MLGSFTLLGREIGWYPLTALIGGLVAGFFCYIMAKKRKLSDIDMIFMLLSAVAGVFVGGHILYAITNIQYFSLLIKVKSFEEFINVLGTIFGGQVFYGGLLGGIAGAVVYAKCARLEGFPDYADTVAPAIPLFHFFGRIGCFLGGCCYGIESDFGFVFTNAVIQSANGVRRFPVQLFESGFNLLLFISLLLLLQKGIMKHRLIFIYLGVYSVGRFILEYFRGDTYRGFLFGFSTSQIISMLIWVFLIIYVIVTRLKKKQQNKSPE